MPDREKIIAMFELYRTGIEHCLSDQLIDDTIALLKEQGEKEQLEEREKHPCEICQEFICDDCPYSDRRGD